MRAAERALDALYAAGWAATQRLPESLAAGLFTGLADLAWRRRVTGVRRLEQNLRRVRPDASEAELRALTRAGMRSYLRYWRETFRLPTWSRDDIVSRVVTHGEERFREAMASGRGVVVALPHLANWDLAGAWACATGAPPTAVAERLRPERLFERFVAYRERLGMEIVALNGGPEPFGLLSERLRAGRLVCLVADRDLSARGIEVDFFGEPARMPAGPAALTLRTGATLLPVTLWYDGPQMHLHFGDPVCPPTEGGGALARMTQELADAFARAVREHPADWHMLQRLWTADLSGTAAPGESRGRVA